MSDLDELEEIAYLPEDSGRKMRRRFRSHGELETHCKRGHELTPDNVYLYQSPGGQLFRHCKKCKRLRLLCREDS